MALHITSVARKVRREGEAADLSLPLPLPGLPLECERRCSRPPYFRLFHHHFLERRRKPVRQSKNRIRRIIEKDR
jgi:hypothetical protein